MVLVLKPIVGIVFMLWRGETPRTALAVGTSVAQVSEFSFLLAGLATGLGLLPDGGRGLVISAAVGGLAARPPLLRATPPREL